MDTAIQCKCAIFSCYILGNASCQGHKARISEVLAAVKVEVDVGCRLRSLRNGPTAISIKSAEAGTGPLQLAADNWQMAAGSWTAVSWQLAADNWHETAASYRSGFWGGSELLWVAEGAIQEGQRSG